ncbi:uncharacterized protein LOC118197866 [Stegodyphus dumicola]|uniref:uncharacterized protein LOC118197866 n=1 Tax=Stegodyphus dumicola TaxID=202533 RepID=UPI0015AA81FC|nr:uncharacterized protein LOC118197866 [Stegodyphus dumicola]
MFPDSLIARRFSCSERKLAYLCHFGLTPYFQRLMYNESKKLSHFTLLFDETLNTTNQKKQLDLHVRYWHPDQNKVVTRFLTSDFMEHTTAANIFIYLVILLYVVKKLDIKKLLQISMEGPVVNWKFYETLQYELKKEYGIECISIGSCGLHILNNAFRKGASTTSWDVPSILGALYHLFKDSSACRENFLTDSYKRLKEISVAQFCDPLTDEDELKEKKQMKTTEIGILTLSVDSSISELTSKKVNFAKDMILDIIEGLNDTDLSADTSEYNSRVEENLSSNNGRSASDIRTGIATEKDTDTIANTSESRSTSNGSLTSENVEAESDLKISVKNKNIDSTTKTSESSSRSNGCQIPENRSTISNLKISGKFKNTDITANASKSNSRRNKNLITKNHKRKSSVRSVKYENTDSNSQNSNSSKTTGLCEKCETLSEKFVEMNTNFPNRDDDSESDVSVGSISSIHTSDLSSFDDVISISSEDESGQKKRKKISINEANKKYFHGHLYDIYEAVSSGRGNALRS